MSPCYLLLLFLVVFLVTIIQLEVSADMRSIAPILALLYLVMPDLGGAFNMDYTFIKRVA